MATSNFDPTKYGATPVITSTFDPTKYGATPVVSKATPLNEFGLGGSLNPLNSGSTQAIATSGGSFMKQAFGNERPGVLSGVVKTTIGEQGAGGLAARPIVSALTANATKPVADSQAQLAQVTTALIKKIGTLPPGDPTREHLMGIVQENQQAMGISNDTLNNLQSVQETQKENFGTALNTAATAAGALNPSTFASKMLLSTGIGGAYGAGQKLNENASPTEILKGAAVGGVIGAATQGAMSGINYLAKKATQELPETLLTKKLGFTPKEIQNGANDKAVQYILDNRKVGSISGLTNEAENTISSLDDKVDGALASGSFSKGSVVSNNAIADATAKRLQANGWNVTGDDVLNAVNDYVGQGQGSIYLGRDANNVIGANELRKGIDIATKPSAFLASKNPQNTTMAMEFADTLRSAVQNIAPETKPWFSEMSKNIALRNALETSASKGFKIGGMMDILSALMGGVAGTATGNPIIGIPAGIAAERAATSMPAVSATSVALNELGKLAPYLGKLTPPLRLFLLNTLSHGATASPSPVQSPQ